MPYLLQQPGKQKSKMRTKKAAKGGKADETSEQAEAEASPQGNGRIIFLIRVRPRVPFCVLVEKLWSSQPLLGRLAPAPLLY